MAPRAPTEEEVTPVEVPSPRDNGARGSLKDIEGMPEAPLGSVDSGPIKSGIMEAVGASEESPTAIAIRSAIIELMGGPDGGSSGGGVPPETHAKSVKRHNWITALAVAIFGSGGLLAGYYAMQADTEVNTEKIQKIEPQVENNTAEVRYIKARIETVGTDVAEVKAQQITIGTGIEQLKKEAQTEKQQRLEDKAEAQERKIRMLERELRNRNR